MLTQHYKLQASPKHIKLAKPGQAVFDEEDQEIIIGFIDNINDGFISVMLFKPTEIEDERVTHIAEACDYIARLNEILDNDHEMLDMWAILTEHHPLMMDQIDDDESQSEEPLFAIDEDGQKHRLQ